MVATALDLLEQPHLQHIIDEDKVITSLIKMCGVLLMSHGETDVLAEIITVVVGSFFKTFFIFIFGPYHDGLQKQGWW